MRDLANQSIIRRKGMVLKRTWIFALVFVLVVVFLASLLLNSSDTSSGGDSANLKDAPKGLKPVKLAEVVSTGGGIDLSKNSATLSDVKYGGLASGTATRTFGDGSFSLSVSATLPDPKGDKYQVWLTNGSEVKNAGFMNGSGKSWSVVFRDKDIYSKFNEVWVTRELTTEGNQPETHVLEGSF